MNIEKITTIDSQVVSAMAHLLPQLKSTITPPTHQELVSMVSSDDLHLFVAKDEEDIVGTLSLVFYRIPTGQKAWIEDVVVDSQQRGKGVGVALMQYAIRFAQERGITKIDLTTSYDRVAANQLYQKLGFQKRSSNLYRFDP